MKKFSKVISPFFFVLVLCTCQEREDKNYRQEIAKTEYLRMAIKKLTDVIVHDIFSPPVASRIYAYPSIAAYHALLPAYPAYQSLAGKLKGLNELPKPEKNQDYCFELASLHAFLTVGKKLVFSEEKIEEFEKEFYLKLKKTGISNSVYERSMAYGQAVAQHIIAWSALDNYKQTRTFPKYTIRENVKYWKPTPPAYLEGIEPNWNKIRPFVLDSAAQFTPPLPTQFSADKNSQFYKEVVEVYETGKNLSKEQREIASFWDCNPFVSHIKGHAMFATKKITPGGHWISIVGIATKKAKLDFMQTTEAYMKVSIALFEGFLSCWDEKWRSILVRPETLINQWIDEDWAPLLQTPPFPEYTSGHSVISNAAATVLTDLLGDKFAYTDSTEIEYGLPVRSFTSFKQAAEEAAISRLYGGIHYRPAIENGSAQGRKVGEFVIKRLKTRKESVARR